MAKPKQITFEFEGTNYTLEYTRKSIEKMERQGFLVGEVAEKPMTMLPTLFAGAFLAHHRFVKKDVTDRIFRSLGNKEELLENLVTMYNEPIEALMSDDEDAEGNVEWGASW